LSDITNCRAGLGDLVVDRHERGFSLVGGGEAERRESAGDDRDRPCSTAAEE